jgi:signal transduction histidine kinase
MLGYLPPHQMRRFLSAPADRLIALLAVCVCLAMSMLIWFGYRAVAEWRNSTLLLAERQASQTNLLMLESFTRDMSGVQQTILTSPRLNQFASHRPHDATDLVASTFARYLYPEALFAWTDQIGVPETVFFCRLDRLPAWAPSKAPQTIFPVVILRQPAVAKTVFDRILADASRGRQLSAFELTIEDTRYQVVAQLYYRDLFRDHLTGVVGFIVNLPWAKAHYFPELARQTWATVSGTASNLTFSMTDSAGAVIVGSPPEVDGPLTKRQSLRPLFFDSDAELFIRADLSRDEWMLSTSASDDPTLRRDIGMANRIIAVGAISALTLVIGLSFVVYASRAVADLSQLRSDFVSAVTHELKTPIATIKAAAETLSKDRLTRMSIQSCGRIVMMEAGHLSRLIDNLLAYSRIADVADTYAFAPLSVGVLFNDIQQDSEGRLDHHGFELSMTSAADMPDILGDRSALRLLFDNLVDNAMKYSGAERKLLLKAYANGRTARIEVIDSGIGIPPEEIPLVTQKFVRGRHARAAGSGLGLAIATRIAEDHGGSLRISSVVGTGTTVTVTLPLAI